MKVLVIVLALVIGSVSTSAVPRSFVACGCGCCLPLRIEKIVKVTRQEMVRLIRADRQASRSPYCARVGCALGIRYVR